MAIAAGLLTAFLTCFNGVDDDTNHFIANSFIIKGEKLTGIGRDTFFFVAILTEFVVVLLPETDIARLTITCHFSLLVDSLVLVNVICKRLPVPNPVRP